VHHRIEFQFQPGVAAAAMATGKLTLITGAMAREIVVGKDGKAEAVSYIDKATRTRTRVRQSHRGCRQCLRNPRDSC